MKDKQWHFTSGRSNFFIFVGRAQGEVKRARQIWRAEEPWEQARRRRDSTQTVWEGDKAQIRSCIYLIDILPLILMEILSPRACQWKPNPPPKGYTALLKAESRWRQGHFHLISYKCTAWHLPPRLRFPFLAQAEKERTSWMTGNISTTHSRIQGWLFCCRGEFNFAFLTNNYSVVCFGLYRWPGVALNKQLLEMQSLKNWQVNYLYPPCDNPVNGKQRVNSNPVSIQC